MRGQQDPPQIVTHDIGEVFLVLVQRHDALRHPFLLAVQHIDDGKLQNALAGLLQGGIEHLGHFRGQQPRRHRRCSQPDQRDDQGQRRRRAQPDRGAHQACPRR